VLDLNVGKVPVRFQHESVKDESGSIAFGEMSQIDPVFGAKHDYDAVAQATGIDPNDFDRSLPIETVSTGLSFTVTPLKSLAAIERMQVNLPRAKEYLEKHKGKFFYFVSRETVDAAAGLHARMFFYNGEDPATGSAAGCTAAWMVKHGVAKSDERILIEQGVEMMRPSKIFVRAAREGDRVVNVRVGGHAIEVMLGEVFL
jgi:trans-2,3-dihydro-3-hydroxyanthranilate isomerase